MKTANSQQIPQLQSMQAQLEWQVVEQDRKEVLEPNVIIYIFTKGDAEAGISKIVLGQFPIMNKNAYVFFLFMELPILLYL